VGSRFKAKDTDFKKINVLKNAAIEGATKVHWNVVQPRKVTLGDFMRSPISVPKGPKLPMGPKLKNRFKPLDEETMEVMYINTVVSEECADLDFEGEPTMVERRNVYGGIQQEGKNEKCLQHERKNEKCIQQERKNKNCMACTASRNTAAKKTFEEVSREIAENVKFVNSVSQDATWMSLGKGDIVVDSAADESCWPVGLGDAYPTKPPSRRMVLRTANGGDMTHHGEKEIIFKHNGGENHDPIGIKFQVTDVRKPLLAVRRLVEKGNTVVLAAGDGESYIQNEATKVKIPIKKKGGSFVIEAHFVMKGFQGQA
jgi:hypothetical protein